MSDDIVPLHEAHNKRKAQNLLHTAVHWLADGPGREHLRPEDRDDFDKAAWRLRTGRELTQAQARAAWRRLRKYAEALDAAGIPFVLVPEPSPPCEAVRLIEITEDAALLFHDPTRTGYAILGREDGHLECLPIRGRDFKLWLQARFRAETGKTPSAQAVADALGDIEATAVFARPEAEVHVRLAQHGGSIYVDLANAAWEAVEISGDGWRIVPRPPVRFRRPRGVAPLPRPEPGGTLDELRPFVNVADDDAWRLLVAWLVAALRPGGPYPVLVLQGEQGAAKTTTARVLRAVIDPCIAAVRTTPRDERDLAIAASNAHVLAFDNLSGLPSWLSDALARVATGGGFATRELYTNSEEVLFDFVRPIILNGIEDVIARPDLLDRSVILTLPAIPDARRRPEETFWREFEQARPRILGALLDAVAEGLRNVESVKLDRLPRMADFARWVVACEPALPWPAEAFLDAYAGNRAEAVELALESDLVANAIRELLEHRGEWTGTAMELLGALGDFVSEQQRKGRAWPKTARGLAGRVRRAATFLRTVGIEVEFVREAHTGRRFVTLRRSTQTTVTTVTTVTQSVNTQLAGLHEGDDKGDDGDDDWSFASPQPSPLNACSETIGDDGDDGDGNLHPLSARGGPCPRCGGRDFWFSIAGSRLCERCHPPDSDRIVARREVLGDD